MMGNFSLTAVMIGEGAQINVGFALPEEGRQNAGALPFIQTIEIQSGPGTLLAVELGRSIPRNASMSFTLKHVKAGDKLTARFVDSENAVHTAETVVSAPKK